MIKPQIQLQREELLLDSPQPEKRTRVGSFLHQGKNHPKGVDKLSGEDKFMITMRNKHVRYQR